MEQSKLLMPAENTQKLYKYVLEGKRMTISLFIDDDSIFSNADGEIDCPLDMILRQNKISANDLKKWEIIDISFIETVKNVESLLHEIKCATVFDIIRS